MKMIESLDWMCIADSFAGAILVGRDPWQARVVSSSTRVALPLLEKWALRHTRESDCLVMEASGNAFAVAERLRALKRKVLIRDSHSAGKVGKTYCATDRVDAIKIARIYLSARSPLVCNQIKRRGSAGKSSAPTRRW